MRPITSTPSSLAERGDADAAVQLEQPDDLAGDVVGRAELDQPLAALAGLARHLAAEQALDRGVERCRGPGARLSTISASLVVAEVLRRMSAMWS